MGMLMNSNYYGICEVDVHYTHMDMKQLDGK